MEPGDLAAAERRARLGWLVRLRWAFLGAALPAWGFALLLRAPGAPFLLLGLLLLAAYNLLLSRRLRRRPPTPPEADRLLRLQMALDLLILTYLLHFAGGAASPLATFYLFHALLAAALLEPREAWQVAGGAVLLDAGLALLEAALLPPEPIPGLLLPPSGGAVWAAVGLLALTLAFSTYLVTSIQSRLRQRERERSELIARLRQTAEALEAASRARMRAWRRIGHELRSPLSAAVGLLRSGRRQVPAEAPLVREVIDRALERLEGALGMTDDLLSLARIREGGAAGPRTAVPLGELTARILDDFVGEGARKGVELRRELEPDLPPLQGDPAALAALVRNLVENALRYTPSGGVVGVTLRREGDLLVLTVEDTGIGIPPEELPHIFEEFYRGAEARKRVPRGTGLGLSIVRAAAEAHGGRVQVSSRVGKGSRFRVELPLTTALRSEEGPGGTTMATGTRFWLEKEGLERLAAALQGEGYALWGPVLRDGAVVYAPLEGVEPLARGVREATGPGTYRLEEGTRIFDHTPGALPPKGIFHPPWERLLAARRNGDGYVVEEARPEGPPAALLGLRPCDLAGIRILDRVFLEGEVRDPYYAARREGAFLLVVHCTDPGPTCFCASVGTGPRAREGFDLALTELEEGFVVEVGSERGRALVGALALPEAPAERVEAAEARTAEAAGRMGRRLETEGLHDLLLGSLDHPHWEEVAARCLGCTNCTQVCPTCFCYTTEDRPSLDLAEVERVRFWDSCFNPDFAYVHGGNFRPTRTARYRQWLLHKLATWVDQFGTLGCVGCGRCITWCPVGIDLTQEVEALREVPR